MPIYLCIDTNIFIQCAFLEIEEGDDIRMLETITGLLDNNTIKFVVPEVIEIELTKCLKDKIKELTDAINDIKEKNLPKTKIDKKVQKDLVSKMMELVKEREKTTEAATKVIRGLFEHPNTQKLPLTSEILVNTVKHTISGKKPCKTDRSYTINSDNLIIQTLKNYFDATVDDYELIFCSANKSDFTEDSLTDLGNTPKIHPDIRSLFKNISYYDKLDGLLQKRFGIKFTDEDIKKIEEKRLEVLVNDEARASDDIGIQVTHTPESTGTAEVRPSQEDLNLVSEVPEK